MKKKYFVVIVLVLALFLATKAFASLTFSTSAITGTTASTIDVGAGNALNIQTTGNGAVNMGGNLVVAGTLEATGNLLTSSLPKDALTVQGTVVAPTPTSSGELSVFHTNTLWTHNGAFAQFYPNLVQARIGGSAAVALFQGLTVNAQVEPSSSGAKHITGLRSNADNLSTSGDTGTVTGINGSGFHRGSGVVTTVTGVYGLSSIASSSGSLTTGIGLNSGIYATGSGTMVSGYGFLASTPYKSGTGSITKYAAFTDAGSTVATNNTGILLGTSTIPAGNFAIYSTDTDPSVLTGKLTVGSVDITDTGAKPTCDATTRGTFWVDEGGAGVADTVEVCSKDAGDAYAWRALY